MTARVSDVDGSEGDAALAEPDLHPDVTSTFQHRIPAFHLVWAEVWQYAVYPIRDGDSEGVGRVHLLSSLQL
jgi:hypothetical protein